jgi:hypothetical protein
MAEFKYFQQPAPHFNPGTRFRRCRSVPSHLTPCDHIPTFFTLCCCTVNYWPSYLTPCLSHFPQSFFFAVESVSVHLMHCECLECFFMLKQCLAHSTPPPPPLLHATPPNRHLDGECVPARGSEATGDALLCPCYVCCLFPRHIPFQCSRCCRNGYHTRGSFLTSSMLAWHPYPIDLLP